MNQIYDKYEFERIDLNGRFLVKVYNNNAKKAWNRQIEYYSFGTDKERREQYIKDWIAKIDAWNKRKADRKAERVNFVNPAKVGDILESSWGYDQTNVDYYQVTKVMGKMVEIREIGGKHVEGSTYSHGMADHVKPAKDCFLENSKPMRKLVGSSYKEGYSVSINSFASAYKINPEESTYRSWYA